MSCGTTARRRHEKIALLLVVFSLSACFWNEQPPVHPGEAPRQALDTTKVADSTDTSPTPTVPEANPVSSPWWMKLAALVGGGLELICAAALFYTNLRVRRLEQRFQDRSHLWDTVNKLEGEVRRLHENAARPKSQSALLSEPVLSQIRALVDERIGLKNSRIGSSEKPSVPLPSRSVDTSRRMADSYNAYLREKRSASKFEHDFDARPVDVINRTERTGRPDLAYRFGYVEGPEYPYIGLQEGADVFVFPRLNVLLDTDRMDWFGFRQLFHAGIDEKDGTYEIESVSRPARMRLDKYSGELVVEEKGYAKLQAV